MARMKMLSKKRSLILLLLAAAIQPVQADDYADARTEMVGAAVMVSLCSL